MVGFAALPSHDGDPPRKPRLIHEIQALTGFYEFCASVRLIGANPVLTLDELSASNPQWFNSFREKVSDHYQIGDGDRVKTVKDTPTRYYLSLDRHLEALSHKTGSFDYLSTRKIFCMSDELCYIRRNGYPLHFDSSHLTLRGNDLMFNPLISLLSKTIDRP